MEEEWPGLDTENISNNYKCIKKLKFLYDRITMCNEGHFNLKAARFPLVFTLHHEISEAQKNVCVRDFKKTHIQKDEH